jgi:hypothetical protein
MIAQLFRLEFGIPIFDKITFTLRQFRTQVIQLHLINQLFVGFHKSQPSRERIAPISDTVDILKSANGARCALDSTNKLNAFLKD